jgi:hypothetical protein
MLTISLNSGQAITLTISLNSGQAMTLTISLNSEQAITLTISRGSLSRSSLDQFIDNQHLAYIPPRLYPSLLWPIKRIAS